MAASTDITTVSTANSQFGFDLFKVIFKERPTENIFISPFSISVALAMTQLGAREATAAGMEKALCWPAASGETIHQQYQGYLQLLQKSSKDVSLSTANRIYLQKNFNVLKDFMDKTNLYYIAEAIGADFVGNAESERTKINSWVEEQTQSKIKDLIQEGVLGPLTRMVLVNAIYFKGFWNIKFDKTQTREMPFKTSPGQVIQVPLMSANEKYSVTDCKDLDCRAIEIPYKGDHLSMVILLPRKDFGLQSLLDNLTVDKLNAQLDRLSRPAMGKTKLTLPKFEVTSSHSLKAPLCSLGMGDAFDQSTADFSGMTEGRDLCVSEVVHKAFVKVDEEGTEAAAATAVVMKLRCAMMPPEPFLVDRPFLFLIKDKRGAAGSGAGGLVLFMGTVVNPSV